MTRTPRRATGRIAGGGLPRRLSRLMEEAVDTQKVYGDTIDPAPDGRLEVKPDPNGDIECSPNGLRLKRPLGDKNLERMPSLKDLEATATISEATTLINELLQRLRDTGRLRPQ